jgi:hypothetical protein
VHQFRAEVRSMVDEILDIGRGAYSLRQRRDLIDPMVMACVAALNGTFEFDGMATTEIALMLEAANEIRQFSLAHVKQGVAGAYRRETATEKRRRSMALWADWCSTIEGDNVTPFRRIA